MILQVAEDLGYRSGEVVQTRIQAAIDSLARMPTRHMQMRYLKDRRFVYRRILIGKHYRAIFTINELESLVEVVRIDSQRRNPASLDDLP